MSQLLKGNKKTGSRLNDQKLDSHQGQVGDGRRRGDSDDNAAPNETAGSNTAGG